jgi:hypothetical protein
MGEIVKHTPGPWFETKFFDIMDSNGTFIGVAFRRTPGERAANTCLIAAAPDLLEATRNLLRHLSENFGDDASVWVREAEAALAKAEGRP